MRTKAFSVILFALLGNVIQAEVIELDGTVKSIDLKQMAITIVRKTPKGEKEIEFELAKNAGDFSELVRGDMVSFAYHPDAEIVTKIEKCLSEDGKRALEELKGVWIAVRVDRHGTMMTRQELRDQSRRIIFEENRITFEEIRKGNLVKFGGSFKINPHKKTIDIKGKGPRGAEMLLLGIYEVTGNELKFCFRQNADGNAQRPSGFRAYKEQPNYSMSYTCMRVPLE